MSNTIKLKRGSGSDPSASDLVVGEVALRTDSGKLFTKKDDNSVSEIGGGSGAIDDNSVTGAKLSDNLDIPDDNTIRFGDSQDLQIFHDSSNGNSHINESGSGSLVIKATNTYINSSSDESMIAAIADAQVALYYNGNQKLETLNNGVNITGSLTLSGTVDGRDVAADGTKLDGIESNATADQTASEILTLLKTVDGNGSGLDADRLQDVDAAFLRNASNLNSGTISDARLPSSISSDITGNAATATTLATARTIGGASFDGSANVDISYNDLTNNPTIPTNNNQLTNGAGYITATLTNEQVQDIVGGMVSSNTESGITVTYQDSDGTIDFSVASQTDNNFTDTLLSKLNGIASGATNVTNNNQLTNGAGYSTFSGSYNDLSSKPTIPTNNNQLSNGAGYITSADGGNAATVDGIDSSQFLRSDTGDTASGDITFSGGAGAATIAGNSDIRFTNGDWTGNSCKIQHHDNSLYIQAGSHGTHAIVLRNVTGSNRWYMNPDGDFFPADDNDVEIGQSGNRVQNMYLAGGIYLGGTGSANYLDDYEEGDWTPSLLGGSNGAGGYSIRDGSYVKIGRMVHVNFGMAITSKGSMSGDLNVGSLPFTVQHIINDTSIEASGICGYWKHVDPNSSTLTLVAEQDSNIFVRHTVGPEDDPDQMSSSHIDSDFTIRGSITYFTSQ